MAEAGWYRDKQDATILRKWDGHRWTGETADFAPPPPVPEPEIIEPIDWGPEPVRPTPWWRNRWSLLAGALGIVAVIGLASQGGGDDSSTNTTTGPVDTSPRQAATTVAPAGTPEQAQADFASIFDNGRTPLASILGDDRNVKSLDRFDYDAAAGVVTLGITSVWTTTAEQANGAWELTRAVAELYKPGRGQWWQDVFVPSFRLINSGQSRTCTGDLMVQLGTEQQGRAAWEASC